MASYMLRGLPSGLIARAKARAREAGVTLDDVLVAFLERYAEGNDPSGAGRKGGAARAAKLSPERRTEIARHAANTRWESEREHDE